MVEETDKTGTEEPAKVQIGANALGRIAMLSAFAIVLTISAAFYVDRSERAAQLSEFNTIAEARVDEVRQRIDTSITLLGSLKVFLVNSEDVTPAEFSGFTNSISLPNGLLAIDWGSRKSKEPHYQDAMEQARRSGNFTITSRFKLSGGKGRGYGVTGFLPIYRDGNRALSADERVEKLAGFGVGKFDTGKLVQNLAQSRFTSALKLDIVIFDVSELAAEQVLVPHDFGDDLTKLDQYPFLYRRDINMGSRKWAIIAVPKTLSTPSILFSATGFVLLIGGLSTLALTRYLFVTQRQIILAEQLADKRQNQVKQAKKDNQASKAQVELMALYDELTGLANRKLFHNMLDRDISHAKRHNRKVFLLLANLNKFKDVNDQYGNHAGDEVLREAAERLVQATRSEDLVARFSGDEFVVLIDHAEQIEDAVVVVNKIIDDFGLPYDIVGTTAHIGISIGISAYPEHGENSEEVVRAADLAMQAAKAGGGGYEIAFL